MSKTTHTTRPRGHCCYILQSESWPTPYTGKTCNLARRLHRHNHPSKRSRAYTKGKGPWRVAAAVYGMRSNRQSVWLERALKRHAKGRARPAGLGAVQTAILDAVRVSSRPSLWWRAGGLQPRAAPTLQIHVFKCALTAFPDQLLFDAMPTSTAAQISCHHQSFDML
jgi:predicted GIY-YIG superfamily endonuclease